MLEGQLEVGLIVKEVEEEQTISVYQNSHSTRTIPLGHKMEEHTCMVLSIRLQLRVMIHLTLSLTTMSHVQCATL